MSSFSIGVSAMSAAQAGLLTAEHNISNVNTPGFHRQQIVQGTNVALPTGVGFLGQGVHVDTVTRIFSQMLDGQVMQAQTQSSYLDAYNAQIKQLDNMLADPSSGISPALQGFFSGVQDVATNAASVPSRQAMLSGAQTMVARFQSINQRFTEIRDGVNSEIRSSVAVINSYSQLISNLNQQIAVAQGASGGAQPANDLHDQRDLLIGELNKVIKVTTSEQSDGSLNVFIGNGQTLVIGAQSFTLGAEPSDEDPEKLDVGLSFSGRTIKFPKGTLQGGTLGGVLAFRDETLDVAQNTLGRVAIGLSQTFNDQHRLGMDLNDNLGGDFFNVAAPKIIPKIGNPTGANAIATFNDVGLVTTSDYRLSYSGGATPTWSLLNVSTNQAVPMTGSGTVGDPFVAEGMNIVVTPPTVLTEPASFLIKPTVNGARDISVKLTDTSEIAAAAPIKTSALFTNTGTGAISAGSVTAVDGANPLADITLTYDSATNEFIVGGGLPATLAYNPAGASYTLTQNGWSIDITISGTPADNDSFTVSSNAGGVADNRNALLLAGLQTQNTLAKNTLGSGTASYQSAYSQLVSFVGNKTREVEVTAKAQAGLVLQTQQAQQSLSGVNLDEEAANLLRYQQAYQAAGKMIQIATTLFSTLLSLGQ